ncbi:MAG TPA: glycosyltransferase family 39 protein [Candidatus Bathyarchaeia archaeon]|nr:glycosyltransferase family 39 protein [Candidatus Bathyarchaeia archaeon]
MKLAVVFFWLKKHLLAVITVAVFAAALLLRISNLNYNVPFTDEAIYVVVGKMGLFDSDWWSYGAKTWMAGSPYVYPVMTAIAYSFGGIVGSRFLNVIFGLLTIAAIFWLACLLSKRSSDQQLLAGLIAAAILAFAPVSLYLSRLATYDMPSFCFFFFGLAFLLSAEDKKEKPAKAYFLASILLFLAFMTKMVIAIYLPFVFLYSLFKAKKSGGDLFNLWRKYFFLPLVILFGWYGLTNLAAQVSYSGSQISRERMAFSRILFEFWQNSGSIWFWWLVGSIGLLWKKQSRQWLVLTAAGLLVFLFHLVTRRLSTLDKHTFIGVAFLSLVAGLGIGELIWQIKPKVIKAFFAASLAVFLIAFVSFSYQAADRYNYLWLDSSLILNYLTSVVKSGDKLLIEIGPPVILATYDYNNPVNNTTFDWFEYQGESGDQAYAQAAADGYFDYIQLTSNRKIENGIFERVHRQIWENLGDNYRLVYADGDFYLYRRT